MTSAADANAVPVAENTLAAIIFAGKKAPFLAADEQRAYGGWGSVTGYGDLSNFGRTVGIVGFSRIGRQVVELEMLPRVHVLSVHAGRRVRLRAAVRDPRRHRP
ncbi:hypothetical protein QQY66_42795 [Streptomyces sp. DG2A-72]|uniref:hypothetical protein n=1 Tax=Streptomyces sp. DG2A-72 TaxID=3051386 RepID=UPI00265C4CA1|nr:hypothetical protein [Streptomyces sp. DG2A-72]MDO0938130.1 hypothetical protein [Streptomyces sp. DG2A-72]